MLGGPIAMALWQDFRRMRGGDVFLAGSDWRFGERWPSPVGSGRGGHRAMVIVDIAVGYTWRSLFTSRAAATR
jgi:hypothetical protein